MSISNLSYLFSYENEEVECAVTKCRVQVLSPFCVTEENMRIISIHVTSLWTCWILSGPVLLTDRAIHHESQTSVSWTELQHGHRAWWGMTTWIKLPSWMNLLNEIQWSFKPVHMFSLPVMTVARATAVPLTWPESWHTHTMSIRTSEQRWNQSCWCWNCNAMSALNTQWWKYPPDSQRGGQLLHASPNTAIHFHPSNMHWTRSWGIICDQSHSNPALLAVCLCECSGTSTSLGSLTSRQRHRAPEERTKQRMDSLISCSGKPWSPKTSRSREKRRKRGWGERMRGEVGQGLVWVLSLWHLLLVQSANTHSPVQSSTGLT